MTIRGRIARATAGRTRGQQLWRKMHHDSLFGRNFGQSEVDRTGELSALRRARSLMPDAAVLFDVGANHGDWALAALDVWPRARVHAFEPAGTTFRRLVEATAGRVECVRAACGAAVDTAVLHKVPGMPGLSSLVDRDLAEHDLRMSESEEVPVTTVDSYCAERGIDRIDFLKIDAEGHDLAVLQGAAGMIDGGQVPLVQFEFGGANIDSRTFLRDFVRLLEPRYRLYRLLVDGLEELQYRETEEIFLTANFLAVSHDLVPTRL